MKIHPSAIPWLIYLLAFGGAAFHGYRDSSILLSQKAQDPAAAFDECLSPLRAALKGSPEIGYFSDQDEPLDVLQLQYARTLYNLAPVRFVDISEAELAVGLLRDPEAPPGGWEIDQRFPCGVTLMRSAFAR